MLTPFVATTIKLMSRMLAPIFPNLPTTATMSVHGVFMCVHGMGVLIQGPAGIGKSELALTLISRGHRLIADDVTEFYLLLSKQAMGLCPALLQDFLYVRGLGLLNIRALFGKRAVKRAQSLNLIITLTHDDVQYAECISIQQHSQRLCEVDIPQQYLSISAGRNMALLVEVMVKNYALQLSGINAAQQFKARQAHYMQKESTLNTCN